VNGRIGVEFRSRKWNHSFQWLGFDKNGVSRWVGNRNALKFGAIVLSSIGYVLLAIGSCVLLFGRQGTAAAVLGGVGFFQLGLAYWLRGLHRKFTRLQSIQDVAEATNADPAEIQTWAENRNLKPKAMLNGEYVYEPTDFDEEARLLRSAQAPNEEVLLRPSQSAQTDEETLLHIAEEPSKFKTPTTTIDPERLEPLEQEARAN
jgi:hypothetical protein